MNKIVKNQQLEDVKNMLKIKNENEWDNKWLNTTDNKLKEVKSTTKT